MLLKNCLPIIIVGILIISGIGAIATQTNEKTDLIQTEKIQLSNPTINQFEQYITINLEESESFLMETGKPMLPMITKTFYYPLGTVIKNVDVDYDTQVKKLDSKIRATPKPVPLTDLINVGEINVIDTSVYESTDLYPSEPIIINKGVGMIKGENKLILNIKIIPQYIPAADTIILPDNQIDIKVEYETPETPYNNNLEEYDLLIVAPEKFANDLQPLINHKNNIGTETILKTTEEIYSTYNQGRDDAEKIKLCIYDMKEDYNIKYVLLAGGRKGQTFNWYIPERIANNDDGWEGGYSTDLYYADIYKMNPDTNQPEFEDWDDNGNDVFAEWSNFIGRKDQPDYYPDVYVGRLPFRYNFEIGPVVDKIINYENSDGGDWFKKALLVSGDTSPPSRNPSATRGVYEGELSTAVTGNSMENAGFNVVKLWLSIPGVWTGSQDVINAISNGAGFIHFAGHGNPASWGNHPPDDQDHVFIQGFQLKDMNKYSNGYKLPVIVIGGCHNAQFNTTMSNIIRGIYEYGINGYFFNRPMRFYYMEWVPRDTSTGFLFAKNGGSIASIGNAGLGYGYINEYVTQGLGGWLNPRFFDAYANQSNDILGAAHAQAITDYINIIGAIHSDQIDRKSIEEWTLIGDPSIHLGGI